MSLKEANKSLEYGSKQAMNVIITAKVQVRGFLEGLIFSPRRVGKGGVGRFQELEIVPDNLGSKNVEQVNTNLGEPRQT